MSELPENFTDDIQDILDAAEIGEKGCLLPERDDPREERGCDEFED